MSSPVETLVPTDNLQYARERMMLGRLRHLPVVEQDVLVGLITMSDILGAVHSELRGEVSFDDDTELLRRTEAQAFMRGAIETIGPDADVIAAAEAMLEQKIGCLPVVDERYRLVGIVTDSDFVRLAQRLLTQQAAAPARHVRVKKAG